MCDVCDVPEHNQCVPYHVTSTQDCWSPPGGFYRRRYPQGSCPGHHYHRPTIAMDDCCTHPCDDPCRDPCQDFVCSGGQQQQECYVPCEPCHEDYWRLTAPPPGHDVFLPASMAGQYKLFFATHSDRGRPVKWSYKHWDKDKCPAPGPANVVGMRQCDIPEVTRAIGYKEPCYIPDYGLHATCPPCDPLPCRAPPTACVTHCVPQERPKWDSGSRGGGAEPPKTTTPYVGVPMQTGEAAQKGWRVFHGNDSKGSHTVVCIEDTLVEIRPQQTVQVTETTPEAWFSKLTHGKATCLGDRNGNFTHCFLAYSESAPKTHALVGRYALHLDAAVPLGFTRASDAQILNQCPI